MSPIQFNYGLHRPLRDIKSQNTDIIQNTYSACLVFNHTVENGLLREYFEFHKICTVLKNNN